MDELKELNIIKRLKNRDETALLEIIEEFTPLIKTIVYKRLSFLPEERDEVINDIFLKIWNNIDSFDSSLGSLNKWIATVANYESIDRLRKILRREKVLTLNEEILSKEATPEELFIQEEMYNQLVGLLESLKEEDRNIFIDLFFQDESYEEVSKKYGITIATLYNRVSRGRKALRDLREEENLWKIRMFTKY